MGQNGTRNRTAGVLILGSIRQGLKFWAPICEGLFDLEARVWLFFMVLFLGWCLETKRTPLNLWGCFVDTRRATERLAGADGLTG